MRRREGSLLGAGLAAMGICCATTTIAAAGLGAVAIGIFVLGPLAAVMLGIILIALIRYRRVRGVSPDATDLEPRDVGPR